MLKKIKFFSILLILVILLSVYSPIYVLSENNKKIYKRRIPIRDFLGKNISYVEVSVIPGFAGGVATVTDENKKMTAIFIIMPARLDLTSKNELVPLCDVLKDLCGNAFKNAVLNILHKKSVLEGILDAFNEGLKEGSMTSFLLPYDAVGFQVLALIWIKETAGEEIRQATIQYKEILSYIEHIRDYEDVYSNKVAQKTDKIADGIRLSLGNIKNYFKIKEKRISNVTYYYAILDKDKYEAKIEKEIKKISGSDFLAVFNDYTSDDVVVKEMREELAIFLSDKARAELEKELTDFEIKTGLYTSESEALNAAIKEFYEKFESASRVSSDYMRDLMILISEYCNDIFDDITLDEIYTRVKKELGDLFMTILECLPYIGPIIMVLESIYNALDRLVTKIECEFQIVSIEDKFFDYIKGPLAYLGITTSYPLSYLGFKLYKGDKKVEWITLEDSTIQSEWNTKDLKDAIENIAQAALAGILTGLAKFGKLKMSEESIDNIMSFIPIVIPFDIKIFTDQNSNQFYFMTPPEPGIFYFSVSFTVKLATDIINNLLSKNTTNKIKEYFELKNHGSRYFSKNYGELEDLKNNWINIISKQKGEEPSGGKDAFEFKGVVPFFVLPVFPSFEYYRYEDDGVLVKMTAVYDLGAIFRKYIAKVQKKIRTEKDKLLKALSELPIKFKEYIDEKIPEEIADKILDVIGDKINGWFSDNTIFGSLVSRCFGESFNNLGVRDKLKEFIKKLIRPVMEKISGKIEEAIRNVVDKIKNEVEKIYDEVEEKFLLVRDSLDLIFSRIRIKARNLKNRLRLCIPVYGLVGGITDENGEAEILIPYSVLASLPEPEATLNSVFIYNIKEEFIEGEEQPYAFVSYEPIVVDYITRVKYLGNNEYELNIIPYNNWHGKCHRKIKIRIYADNKLINELGLNSPGVEQKEVGFNVHLKNLPSEGYKILYVVVIFEEGGTFIPNTLRFTNVAINVKV